MSMTRKRSIKTAQIEMRIMHLFVQGTAQVAGAVTPLGFDRLGIKKIDRSAAGTYVITFKKAFRRAVMGFTQVTSNQVANLLVTVTSASAITVVNKTAAADVDFLLQVVGSEFAYDVE